MSTRALFAITLAIAGCGGPPPIEDAATETNPFQEQLTLWDDGIELFYHHSPLVAGVTGQPWAVHVTDLETFQPVVEATVRLQFYAPDAEPFEVVVDAPDRPGLFTPEPVFPVGGAYDLSVFIERPGRTHEVYVGPIIVYATTADVPNLPEEEAVGIAFLKEQQWAVPFATVEATVHAIARSIDAIGEVIPTAGGYAAVAAPVDGIVRADAGRSAPVPGQWV